MVKLPLKDDGVDKAGVLEILEGAGLGLPDILRVAHAQWLYVLFFPTENRMGAVDGPTSRVLRGSKTLRKKRH